MKRIYDFKRWSISDRRGYKTPWCEWRTVIQLYIGCFRSTENIEFLIIEIQGILVPFLSRSIALNPNQPDWLNSREWIRTNRQKFSRDLHFCPKEISRQSRRCRDRVELFCGLPSGGRNKRRTGTDYRSRSTTENALFVINSGSDDELLIPIGDDYIREINHDNKRILVRLPEGLLELWKDIE